MDPTASDRLKPAKQNGKTRKYEAIGRIVTLLVKQNAAYVVRFADVLERQLGPHLSPRPPRPRPR